MRTFFSDFWKYPQILSLEQYVIFQRCCASVAWRRLWQIQDGRLELVSANRNGQHPQHQLLSPVGMKWISLLCFPDFWGR